MQSWSIGEGSANPGGIPARYILKSLIPIGFALMFVQAFAHAIRYLSRLAKGRLMPLNEMLAILMLVVVLRPAAGGHSGRADAGDGRFRLRLLGFGPLLFNLLPNRIFGVVTNYTLIAMPLFVFMGVMLEKSRLAEDLMEVIAHAAGSLRGGLGIGIIVVGVLMGATTGIVGATVVTLGLLTLPTLLRRGYDKGLACGTICASGTLGQIIPPSLILILLADILDESVGTLFAAAMIPGLMLAGIYVVYLLGLGILRPDMVPAGAARRNAICSAQRACRQAVARRAAADRARRRRARLDHRRHRRADRGRLDGCARRHRRHRHRRAHVLGGAARHDLHHHPHHRDDDVHPDLRAGVLACLPRTAGRDGWCRISSPSCRAARSAPIWFLMLIIFILGFFIEWIEISYIAVPLFLPIFIAADVDMVWLATLICVNLQTSFLTPPFGWALFFLRGVAPPEVTTGDIYRGIVPFVAMQLVALVLCFMFPELALWLPKAIGW